jgi:Tfp pilus assembly protein PilN
VPTLQLDFLHPGRAPVRMGMLLLVAGLASVAVVGWHHQNVAAQAAELNRRLADTQRLVRRELPAVQETTGDPKAVAQEVIRANAVLANLAVPWDALFGELEAAADPNVALLSIQPEGGGRRVRLAGESRRFEDLLAYIARLESTAGFANVFLVGHELRSVGAERAVAFTVSADWVGRE